jgi:hypothetical protein
VCVCVCNMFLKQANYGENFVLYLKKFYFLFQETLSFTVVSVTFFSKTHSVADMLPVILELEMTCRISDYYFLLYINLSETSIKLSDVNVISIVSNKHTKKNLSQ